MKKSICSIFISLMLVMVLLSGCGLLSTPIQPTPTATPAPTATPIVYAASIEVVDENGTPIPSAKIIKDGSVVLTDAQGYWQKSDTSSELAFDVWAQGYALQNYSSSLQPGDNKIKIQLLPDSNGLKTADLAKEGYNLVFVEDFQDGIADCIIEGNGNVVNDEVVPENKVMLVDLRNLDDAFLCYFGPVKIQDAILEMEFYYPEIRYNEYVEGGDTHWQGYFINFRDDFDVEGYPLHTPWGATLQIRNSSKDEWTFPITVKQGINEKKWYMLNTKYNGKRVEVRMNNALAFTYLNPPTMINSGPAAFGAFGQAYIEFDNIKMWVPVE